MWYELAYLERRNRIKRGHKVGPKYCAAFCFANRACVYRCGSSRLGRDSSAAQPFGLP